jgi:hypothetical protein
METEKKYIVRVVLETTYSVPVSAYKERDACMIAAEYITREDIDKDDYYLDEDCKDLEAVEDASINIGSVVQYDIKSVRRDFERIMKIFERVVTQTSNLLQKDSIDKSENEEH